MPSFINRYYRLRFVLAVLLLVLLMYLFWSSSRYPSLGDKALLGGSIQLEDPLSFVARFPIQPEFPFWKKIGLSTLNWLDTNRQGMTFGVLFGSVFLSMMRYIKTINFKNPYANSALGLLIGTPLGVCVNCAAPIAKGMYDGGARAETTLSAMIASPTLNIVVLTMLFSILPVYMAATKIALSILLIIVLIPMICRLLPKRDLQIAPDAQRVCPIPAGASEANPETAGSAVAGYVKDILADFWYIFRLTVPLMILAGFLGALISTLVPIESLGNLTYGLAGLLVVALIGTFLPVPIAFDVVICGALLAGGLPVGYVMALLFTLGSFSIYSAFIVTQTISWRPAAMLYGTVMVLGILAGLGVHQWHGYQTQKALKQLTATAPALASNAAEATPLELADNPERSTASDALSKDFDVSLIPQEFSPRSPKGDKLFTKIEAHNIGINQGIEFSFKDMWPPFWEGRSISSGDIDMDGNLDLVIASTEKGLYIYEGSGDGSFKHKTLSDPKVSALDIFNAALVDIDNNGWLDLFITTYGTGNFIYENHGGVFTKLSKVANNAKTPLTLSLSFGDIDKDGDLDAALGNWAAGWYRRIPGEESRNRLVLNDKGHMDGSQYVDLPGIPGETLTILLSDINEDQNLDLLVGNDFEIPDMFYQGNGTGDFQRITRSDGIIPQTTTTTMALKNHDLDNDLVPEIYAAQIAGRSSGISERLNMQPIENYCDAIGRPSDKAICEDNMEIKAWYKSGNNFDPTYAGKCLELSPKYEAECKAMLVKDLAIQAEDPSLCDLISPAQLEAKAYCQIHFWPGRPLTNEDIADNIKQIKGHNVLLKRQADGKFLDRAIESALEVGGWSWDTKIADFDSDEWADMLIVNGTWVPNEVTPSNMFFHNNGSGKFEQRASEFGLEDFLLTAAATQFDMDNDGDLDVITVPVNGPVQAFINNSQTGNSVRFSFQDNLGNYFGVGHKVTIKYSDGKHQKQEVQIGGGFQSFDASHLHFGLSAHETIDAVIVDWVEGGQTVITDPLSVNKHYIIHRIER